MLLMKSDSENEVLMDKICVNLAVWMFCHWKNENKYSKECIASLLLNFETGPHLSAHNTKWIQEDRAI